MSSLNLLCREIYEEARSRFGNAELGFRVLYGPPVHRPPIFFIGFQPGGGANRADADQQAAEMEGWPETFDYVKADWLLARRAREVWGGNVLSRCCGANLVFLRAKSKADWKRYVSADLRRSCEQFGREKLQLLIDAMQPETLIVIGTRTLSELSDAEIVLKGAKRDRPLVRRGTAFGREARAVIHLSGAQISTDDRASIKSYFQAGR